MFIQHFNIHQKIPPRIIQEFLKWKSNVHVKLFTTTRAVGTRLRSWGRPGPEQQPDANGPRGNQMFRSPPPSVPRPVGLFSFSRRRKVKVDNRIFTSRLWLYGSAIGLYSGRGHVPWPRPRIIRQGLLETTQFFFTPDGFCAILDVVLEAVWAELDGTIQSVISCEH